MMNNKLASVLKECADQIVNVCISASDKNNEKANMQNKVYEEVIEVMDTIVSNNVLLNAMIEHSDYRKEVSMQFEDVLQWWRELQIQSSDDLAAALDNFRVVFACNSNGIEGNQLDYRTTREVFEGGSLSNFSGAAKDLFETQNQKFAFNYFIESFGKGLNISMDMIQKLHRIMMYGCYDEVRWNKGERPGEFKKGDYCVGLSDVGSFPDEVEDHLKELLDEMNDNEGRGDVLVKAAFLHVMFETIHPFADGNGRVGRTLMNYYLIRHNYPPIVIYNEDKETYYLALEVFNRTGKLEGFVRFLQEQMVKTWESRIRNKRSGRQTELKKLSAFL